MSEFSWKLKSLSDWDQVIDKISDELKAGVWLRLEGDLGAGKTTFVRRLLQKWGYSDPILSPTYPLVIEYNFEDLHIVHMDAYRLKPGDHLDWDPSEWKESLVFVEWAQNILSIEDCFHYVLQIDLLGSGDEAYRQVKWKKIEPTH